MEVADKLTNAYKVGDPQECQRALQTDVEWTSFCTGKFISDQIGNDTCQKTSDRCRYCCNLEFGDIYLEQKEKCIDNLCKKSDTGRWVWQRDKETVGGQSTAEYIPKISP